MIKWCFIICLSTCCLSNITAQTRNIGNGILNSGIRNLITNYLEWYTLSGFDGRYNSSVEQNFRTLFSEDAVHFNFLPGTRYFLSETSLDNYIKGLTEIYQSYRVYPGIADYMIEEVVKPLPLEIYQVKVSVTNYLHVYSDDGLDTVDISLLLDIYADLVTNTFQVIKVSDNSTDFKNLTFRLFDIDRQPVARKSILFSYLDPIENNVVTRERFSDNNGRVSVSTIPYNALLVIAMPDGYSFVFSEEKTAAEWKSIPENERLLFIKQDITSWFSGRSWIHAEINHGLYINDLFFGFSEDFSQKKQVNFSKPKPGFSLNYSFLFIKKKSFGIAIGTGLNYSSLAIDTNVEFTNHSFPFQMYQGENAVSTEIFSNNVHEKYFFESWNIPASLTFRFKANRKLLTAIDLTTNVSYHFSQSLSFKSDLLDPVPTNSDYNNRLFLENTDYFSRYKSKMIYEDSHFNGHIKQESHLSYGVKLSFNVPLLFNNLWLQASTGYQLLLLGDKTHQPIAYNNTGEEYSYVPSLGFGLHTIGTMNAGLGLLLIF